MTDEQAKQIIELLESIDSRLNPTYTASDICSSLDDVRSDLNKMQKQLSDCVQHLANIDRSLDN